VRDTFKGRLFIALYGLAHQNWHIGENQSGFHYFYFPQIPCLSQKDKSYEISIECRPIVWHHSVEGIFRSNGGRKLWHLEIFFFFQKVVYWEYWFQKVDLGKKNQVMKAYKRRLQKLFIHSSYTPNNTWNQRNKGGGASEQEQREWKRELRIEIRKKRKIRVDAHHLFEKSTLMLFHIFSSHLCKATVVMSS
jgi:hypothetical protein